MKKDLTTPPGWSRKSSTMQLLQNKLKANKLLPLCLAAILAATLSTGCRKTVSDENGNSALKLTQTCASESRLSSNAPLSPQTLKELAQARTATAKYRNINNAIADGYADIDVIKPNMGYHYMKSTLVDTVFDAAKPELLVYNKMYDEELELVAVEYAVPIDQMPNNAPKGFTGDADVWTYDTFFGLWLLHAWVWKYNPAGVFNPTNPNVHVHQ